MICAMLMFNISKGEERACKIFQNNLATIKASVERKDGLNASKISEAIVFFEDITSIKSESDGNFFGRYSPTLRDYNNWSDWFKKNKAKLYWNKIKKKVMVKE